MSTAAAAAAGAASAESRKRPVCDDDQRYSVYRTRAGGYRTPLANLEFVKRGTDGTTAVFHSAQDRVYIKAALSGLGSDDVRRETRANRELAAGGAASSVAEVVYAGKAGGTRRVLVTRALGGEWRQAASLRVTGEQLLDADGLARSIMAALTAMHSAGVIHGDAHCGNFFVSDDRREVRFIDLGFALLDAEFEALSGSWAINPYFVDAMAYVGEDALERGAVDMLAFMREMDLVLALVSLFGGREGARQYAAHHALDPAAMLAHPEASGAEYRTCYPLVATALSAGDGGRRRSSNSSCSSSGSGSRPTSPKTPGP